MSHDPALWILVVGVAVLLGWVSSLSSKLDRVQKQLDVVLSNFHGLREYLYEIDPQFDDERASNRGLDDEDNMFAAHDDLKLLERKESEGRRTLNTPFHRPDGA